MAKPRNGSIDIIIFISICFLNKLIINITAETIPIQIAKNNNMAPIIPDDGVVLLSGQYSVVRASPMQNNAMLSVISVANESEFLE